MPVSISGTTGYAGPLGAITVDTGSIVNNAVTPAKMSRSGSSGQVLTSGGAGADPSYQTLPTSVTSVAGGSGISVSAATGAVTISGAAPSFNAVGSYCYIYIGSSTSGTATGGSTYSAGTGNLQIASNNAPNGATNNPALSGTWRLMTATASWGGCGGGTVGIAVRVA